LDPTWSGEEKSLESVSLVAEAKAHLLEGEEVQHLAMLDQQHEE
jgi:hypothetical protein